MKSLRSIVVEDDENDLLLVGEALESYGYAPEMVWVRTAAELRAALDAAPCDVVLSDYRLPGFSGSDALELVRSGTYDVPFILVTAALGDELAAEMMRRGADDFVLKDRMARLGFAVDRAVRDYAGRRDRARVRHDLAAVQHRFQQTFEHAPIGIVHTCASGRFMMVNDRFCEMLGYTREELQDMTFMDVTHPDDRDTAGGGLVTLLSGRGDIFRAEKRYIRKDDTIIWVDLVATAVRDAAGEFEYVLGMVQEITARKEAEEKVRRQAVLLDAVEQSVIATDVEGYITYWSRYARDLYGWTEAEVLGRHILDVTTPEISQTQALDILERLRKGESWSGEFIVRRRDGSTFPAMVIDSPIFDAGRSLVGIVGVSFDLTEQKVAEAALRRSEERYRGIIEGVVEIIVSVDPHGVVTSANRAFEEATGWTRQEFIGREIWELLPPHNIPSAKERLAQRLHGQDLDLNLVNGQMLRRNGSAIEIDGVAYVARNGDDQPEVFYFLRDVTDRTRAEEERARLDRQFRLVLEATDEGIYVVDADGNCTMLNRAAAQILGYTPEEMLGRRIHDVIHFAHADGTPYDRTDCAVYRAIHHGRTDRVRNEVYWRSDGTAVPVEYASAPVLENGRIIGAVTTFVDVSQSRMLKSQLDKANRLNGLGRIAATIAHEFNNVLMGIQPFTEILRIEARGNEGILRSVDRIATSVRRGKRVTSEILQFTRQSEPTRKPVDVASWIADLAAEARHVIGDSIELVALGDPDLTILGDSAALQLVFMNMIVNARDALDGKGLIVVTARASEGSSFPFGVIEHGDTFVHFTVSDDGPGMSPETVQHIFEPLFTTKKAGTGLGLALAHHVVQQHGGSIFVESIPGAGTAFHVFLPRTEAVVEPKIVSRPARPQHVRSMVLVEDDATVAAGFVRLLALENVRVHVSPTGGEAVETIERAGPDAVVLDVGLPDIDGTLVYEAIARRWPELPVVFATGHATDGDRLSEYLTRPNVGHLLKPYQLTALYDALGTLTPEGAFTAN